MTNNISQFTLYSNYGLPPINLLGLGDVNEVVVHQSMLDDTIRASFTINDSGTRDDYSSGTVDIEEEEKGGLKITSGEKVELIVVDDRGTQLEFVGINEFMIEQIHSSSSDTMIESFDVHLCTPDYVKNSLVSNFVRRRYEGKISDTVIEVLKVDLGTQKDIEADPTLNTLPILGHEDKPLDFCTLLGPKSIPEMFPQFSGYFFYDTYTGYKFKSIDILFMQPEKRKMIFTNTTGTPPGYTNKIVKFNFENSMNVLKNLKTSALSQSTLKTFDNYTNEYVENIFDSDELFQEVNNAAKEKPLVGSYLALEEETSNIINQLYNTGTLPPGSDLEEQLKTAKTPTFNLDEIVRKSIARYNQTFLLRGHIVIPGDFGIYPGDIIVCDFPEISPKDLRLKVSKKKSGKYLVVDVAHMINAEHCYTRLNIVRDTIVKK